MELIIQVCDYLVWFPLAILVISAVLKRGVRHYPLIFAYLVVTLLITVAQMPTALAYHRAGHIQGDWFRVLYAISEGTTYVLMFGVVISLVYRATAVLSARHLLRMVLFVGGPLFAGISFLVHYDSHLMIGMWMTPWIRDLNFCAAVLDLFLWALLLGAREKDHCLLLLSGGMGILFAGDAVGDAVRSIAIRYRSYPIFASAAVITLLAEAGFLYIWWQALRKEPATDTTLRYRQSAING